MKKILVFIFISLFFGLQTSFAQEDKSIELGEIVVTASRMAQHGYKIASDVTVITPEQIQDSGAQNVSGLLSEQVGVDVSDTGSPKTAVIDIRGFGDTASRNVLVLVNDRKVNTMDISGPDILQIPLESIERIEITRGAGSVLYGDNAVGGVINIITKEGKGDLKGKAGLTYGSYESMAEDLELSGEQSNISYYFFSKHSDTTGYRANSDLLAKDYSGRLGYRLSDRLKVSLNTSWHEDDYGLPGGLSMTEIEQLGRRATTNPDDYASTKDRYIQMTFDVAPWPEDIEWGRFVVDYSYRNRDVYDSFNTYGAFNTKRSIDTSGLTGKYIFNQTLFNRDVNFVMGVDFYDSENDILGSGTNVDDITISKLEIGGYGYLEYEFLKDVYMNGGMRYEKARYDFNQRNVVVNQSQAPDVWVYMGGMKYEYAPGSNLHFNVQETFRFLATDEWYSTANYPGFGITPGLNLGLKQQTGLQYETGIKHKFNQNLLAHATVYVLENKNEIFFDPVTFANSNYDKTRRTGVEVGQTTDLPQWCLPAIFSRRELFTNYTYQLPEFIDGPNGGKRIPWAAAHQAGAGFNLGLWERYLLTFSGTYVGSRFAVNDTLNETPPVKPGTVFDLKLAYNVDPLEIYFAINNIFNEKYFSMASKSTFSALKDYFPAPERNYWAGMNVKF